MRNQFHVFQFKFGKNIKFFESRLTKILSASRPNCFLFVDSLFFRVWLNNRFFSSLISNLQSWFKVWLVVFYREFTKLATSVSFFVLVASSVATVGPGTPYALTTACAPPHFGLLRMLFL